ncbi:heme biosynthesis protein HemY [Paraburkholderia hospita]|uniref:HemY domain-containing protein n=1 Tax=Paraburkholderia hospita TaxID=169430 RepID=A0AAN1J9P5_9BURK|nr:heme biosynthesis protein HemY [Paraburkholderia hospita]AUT69002.1 heme biosynthesis protein HemY [Paraburkholderia hospita]EIM96986.1 HemY domain-containing protein [Paraburkholderia hospita]OUL68109.1 heme biosynthesis protein HemY [Paraburkholderia hospita]OUL70462.1 heme biosynthesis protein HemY [Paraburkholderia hospita]SEI19856.1 HemY protein [Paraburkholderia hospita]
MALRGLLWLAFLFAIAVVLAIVGRFDTGQVLLVYPPYRIDISLNLFIVGIIVAFIVIYALLRIVRNIWRMPQRVAAYRSRQRVAKAHAALRDAIGNLYAGRFSRAEKAARDSLTNPDNKGAAGLIAANAAHRMHEYARRDEYLAQIDSTDWQDARLMATADMRADGRDADGALLALTEMQSQGGRRIHAQQIALRAQQQLKNWGEVLKLVKTLEKREAIHPAVAVRLRQLAAENLLRDRRHNADALLELWHSLTPVERHSPRLADVAAELLVALGRPLDARKIVEEALAQNWDARLLRRYPDTTGGDALPLIQKAEAWRKERPDDADLMFALGRLCLHQQLWGKAQSFLEQALKLADNETLKIRSHRALARLHEQLGDADKASAHYRESALAMNVV